MKEEHIDKLEKMRHSCAHLLAAAVVKLWPKTKLGIGPAIEDGFYYDFDFKTSISEDDLQKIEKEMKNIQKTWKGFGRIEKTISEAKKLEKNQPYKLDLINEFGKSASKVSFYKSGDFVDLCKGGHVETAKEIGPFKLLSVAGAYWRGSEKNPMLTRIYGVCFASQKELEEYLAKIEEAKKRDHKRLGQELSLFSFLPQSPGMPYWYPKGFTLLLLIRGLIRKLNRKHGYLEISTPLLAKKEVWETSGHWSLFRENMFTFDMDGQTYALKPMNCPQTLLFYKTKQFSYRDLPMKLSDLDTLHRYEESGTLNGLFRVRELSQDDAHVICEAEQAESIIEEVVIMAKILYEIFDLTPNLYISTRPDKALGSISEWKKAESILEKVLRKMGINFGVKSKEGSFYGPKIDFHVKDSLGRDWQLATTQLDIQMPKLFKATYIDKNGKETTPIMVHRAILGSLERFIGILIEHYGGAFPTWLSPTQVIVLPITDRNLNYGQKVVDILITKGARAELDSRSETLQSKIRNAQLQKIPYMLVVGDKEQVQNKVSIRHRERGDEGSKKIDAFIQDLEEETHLPL